REPRVRLAPAAVLCEPRQLPELWPQQQRCGEQRRRLGDRGGARGGPRGRHVLLGDLGQERRVQRQRQHRQRVLPHPARGPAGGGGGGGAEARHQRRQHRLHGHGRVLLH
ncbi:unnamed protein product, partial [Scytosiphon promiscuus]